MSDKKIFIKRRECERFDQIIRTFPGTLFFYDTETTGVNPKMDCIIQISIARLDRGVDGQYRVTSYFNQYIKPMFPVPEKASQINHITNEFLADKPTEAQAFPIIREYLKEAEGEKAIVIGYNNRKFDDEIINMMYMRQAGVSFHPFDSIDAKVMAEEIVQRKELPDQRLTLSNIAQLYGVLQDNMHNAMTDIMVTGRLTFRLYEDYIDHFQTESSNGKPEILITGMYRFKKSKIVNYVMISANIITKEGIIPGKIRYDVWNKCYEQEEGNLLEIGDFDRFVEAANLYAGGDVAKYR